MKLKHKSIVSKFATNKKETKLPNGETYFSCELGGMEIGFNMDEIKRYQYKPIYRKEPT